MELDTFLVFFIFISFKPQIFSDSEMEPGQFWPRVGYQIDNIDLEIMIWPDMVHLWHASSLAYHWQTRYRPNMVQFWHASHLVSNWQTKYGTNMVHIWHTRHMACHWQTTYRPNMVHLWHARYLVCLWQTRFGPYLLNNIIFTKKTFNKNHFF